MQITLLAITQRPPAVDKGRCVGGGGGGGTIRGGIVVHHSINNKQLELIKPESMTLAVKRSSIRGM